MMPREQRHGGQQGTCGVPQDVGHMTEGGTRSSTPGSKCSFVNACSVCGFKSSAHVLSSIGS